MKTEKHYNTQRAYKRNYGSKSASAARTINKMVQNFEQHGTAAGKTRIGAQKTARSLEKHQTCIKPSEIGEAGSSTS